MFMYMKISMSVYQRMGVARERRKKGGGWAREKIINTRTIITIVGAVRF